MTKLNDFLRGSHWLAMALVLGSEGTLAQVTAEQGAGLEEIVVTAQKRSEKLQDVPIPISVITGQRLEEQKLDSLADLANFVPGLSVQSGGGPGQRAIVLRGLATSEDQSENAPMVATYIDDEPIGASNGSARSAQYGIDMMPYDIEAIEVLKGPQGTVYGADAMGGIVKYTLRKPDLTQFDARVGGDLQNVDGGAGPGANGRAAVNIPLITDVLGLRVSGFYQRNPGFIDNVGTGIGDANESTQSGGRATMLWKPTDNLTLQITAMAQNIDSKDATAVTFDAATRQPIYGPTLRFTYFPEPFQQQMRDYSLHVDWDLDFATLTSSTSWSHMSSARNFDLTPGNYLAYLNIGPTINNLYFDDLISKLTEEGRLTSRDNQRIQWMFGVLYTKEDSNEVSGWPAYTPAYVPLTPPYDLLLAGNTPSTYTERAVFANSTLKLTDRFDISGGLRYAQNEDFGCNSPIDGGGLFVALNPYACTNRPYQGKVTWMMDSRFHLNQDAMVYARIATGYRPGGGCIGCGNPATHTPDFYYSDSLINYEVGFKGELLDHRLQVDTSIFYIDWSNIQLVVPNNGWPYLGNGSSAVSRGVELTTSYAVTDDLRLSATMAFTDAHLTDDAPAVGGANGDQLPLAARWTGSLSADYTRPLDDRRTLLVGGSYRYRDMIVNQFSALPGGSLPMPPQNIVDFYAGLKITKTTLRLYAKNAFNNHSFTGVTYLTDPTKPEYVPIQPRTIGLSVDYQF